MQNQTLVLFSNFRVLLYWNSIMQMATRRHLEGYLESILCFTYFHRICRIYLFMFVFFSSMHILKGVFFYFDFRSPPYSILKNLNFFY